jgi:uncharacterized protein YegJ (DUF2314 family)
MAYLLVAVPSLVLSMAALDAPAASLVERAGNDETVSVADDDPAMRRAFTRARATLDDFLSKLKSPPAGSGGFAVKVGIRSGQDVEYLWIGQLSVEGERFRGRIDNAPRTVKEVTAGEIFTFTRADIVDWLYIDRPRRRMHGNFTACALLTRESPNEAAALKKRLGLSCRE